MHCPTTVGGNAQALARAERELGLDSVSVTVDQDYFGYDADEALCEEKSGKLARASKRIGLLRRALREFDVIHYNFGSTILPPPRSRRARTGIAKLMPNWLLSGLNECELAMLKRAGKGIVVTFQGDDIRQRDYSIAKFPTSIAHHVDDDYYPPGSDALKRRKIARFAKYADCMYALNPDLLHVLPDRAEFLPYTTVDLRQWQPRQAEATTGRPVVVHAPSHRGAKGTKYVLEAIGRLKQADHIDLEFVLVEGLRRSEARRIYERADLVVDQLFCGWYGGLAVEAMALGKAVVTYIRDDDLKFVPKQLAEDLPVLRADAHTLYHVLRRCLQTGRDELVRADAEGRQFVERWHDPLTIALRLKEAYQSMVRR